MTAELSRKANQCARGAETAVRPSIPPLRHATAGQRIPTVRSFKGCAGRREGEGGTKKPKHGVPKRVFRVSACSQLICLSTVQSGHPVRGRTDILLVRGDTCLSVCYAAKEGKDEPRTY